MDIASNNNEEQKAHHILRITDIEQQPFDLLTPIHGYEDMALVTLEIAVEPLVSILPDIQRYASHVKQRCQKAAVDRLSNDESASIMLYTMGWKPLDQCLYVALNKALRTKERDQLEPWFLYLKLFLTALSRLPSIYQHVYREIEFDLSKEYQIGETVVWWGFSSCTTSINVLQSELTTIDTRTLFTIECISGKDIRPHSYFPLEDEILLFPMTQFQVQACSIQSNGIHSIQLQEIQPFSPLLYPLLPSSQSNKSFSDKFLYLSVYDFNGIPSSGELSFRKDDQLHVLDKYLYNNWWKAKNMRTKEVGYVPANYLSAKLDLTAYKWYFTDISRHDAEGFLRQAHHEKGTFLIRPSENNQGEESMSILDSNDDKHFTVRHYRIRRTDQGLYFIRSTQIFPSLQDLVNHYQTTADGLCCLLIHPGQDIESINQYGLLELDRSQLLLTEFLGGGNWSEVYKGTYKQRPVAIKYLMMDQNLNQAKVMKELRHKNILRFYGVCTEEEPVLIVTQLMIHGCLLEYLRDGSRKFCKLKTILDFAVQIIDGMIYLGEEGYVHCDLAARNIFLEEFDVVKIGGLDLARILEDDWVMIDEESQFSIRWTAPEVLTKNEYTIKSDVWSFGILLYELITRGSSPYSRFLDNEVLQAVLDGYRMPKPYGCHEQYYQIMYSCWQENPDYRPTFETLSMRLHEFMMQDEPIYQNDTYTEV